MGVIVADDQWVTFIWSAFLGGTIPPLIISLLHHIFKSLIKVLKLNCLLLKKLILMIDSEGRLFFPCDCYLVYYCWNFRRGLSFTELLKEVFTGNWWNLNGRLKRGNKNAAHEPNVLWNSKRDVLILLHRTLKENENNPQCLNSKYTQEESWW